MGGGVRNPRQKEHASQQVGQGKSRINRISRRPQERKQGVWTELGCGMGVGTALASLAQRGWG